MGDPGPFGLDALHDTLGRLEKVVADPQVVLVGGQAVSVWLAQLEDQVDGTLTAAEVLSSDLDLLGTAATARQVAAALGARLQLATWEDHTPLVGVALFVDGDGVQRRLDVMSSVYGMGAPDLRDTAIKIDVRVDEGAHRIPVWVMHPERTMESRVHNSALPNKQTELAYRQLRASILCARAFSAFLLDDRAAVRDVLKLNERIFRFALRDRQARELAITHEIECFDAVLADDRLGSQFGARRLPQMQAQIAAVRERDRAAQSQPAGPSLDRGPSEPQRPPPTFGH